MSDNGETIETLGDKLLEECGRVRGLIGLYRESCGAAGGMATAMMESALRDADQAMIQGDPRAMIAAYQRLQEFTG